MYCTVDLCKRVTMQNSGGVTRLLLTSLVHHTSVKKYHNSDKLCTPCDFLLSGFYYHEDIRRQKTCVGIRSSNLMKQKQLRDSTHILHTAYPVRVQPKSCSARSCFLIISSVRIFFSMLISSIERTFATLENTYQRPFLLL